MKRISILMLILFTCLVSAAWPQVQGPGNYKFTTFDAPEAGTFSGQGTFAFAINPKGWIAGEYQDAKSVWHSFLRKPDGTITTIDAPDAGTFAFEGTRAGGDEHSPLNAAGAIAGWYIDAHRTNHGFVRAPDPDGKITEFDAPDAGTGVNQGTIAASIDPKGWITGWYFDAKFVYHGFLRLPYFPYTIREFDAPGAGTGAGQGTLACGKWGGVIWGFYVDVQNTWHGFWLIDGTFTTIDAPSAGTGANRGTVPFAVNSKGVMVGFSKDANFTWHGFMRTPDGTITEFDAPGAGTGRDQGTIAASINPTGWITGDYVDANNVDHGFVRTPDPNGTIREFDVPGAQGTRGFSINPTGAITGLYWDAKNVFHGFLAYAFSLK